jgi:hypothetical protein
MPAVSIDTFFACSLMVMLVLSAMAATTTFLRPHMNTTDGDSSQRLYRELSKYLLLNEGMPSNWGQNGQTIPETFGLARSNAECPYELDGDKVSRLNDENLYAISYAEAFTSLEAPDTFFKIEIKPLFDVKIRLDTTFDSSNDTIYQFEISTERNGVPISTQMRIFTVAEAYLKATSASATNGETMQNVTIPDIVNGPALLAVVACSAYNDRIMSFNACAFARSSAEPNLKGTFLKLSPLNHSLTASFSTSGIDVTNAYALTLNHEFQLEQMSNTSESTTYEIPKILDSGPTILVLTGTNSTKSFIEWTAYPQIPVEMGADFADSQALSDVFSFTYLITIDSIIYDCTVWLGGPA